MAKLPFSWATCYPASLPTCLQAYQPACPPVYNLNLLELTSSGTCPVGGWVKWEYSHLSPTWVGAGAELGNIFRFWEITKKYYELNKNGIAFLWGDRGLWSYNPKHIPFKYIHLVLRSSLRDYTGPYGTIRDHTGSYGTIQDHTGAKVTIADHRRPYETIWDLTGLCGPIRDHTGP